MSCKTIVSHLQGSSNLLLVKSQQSQCQSFARFFHLVFSKKTAKPLTCQSCSSILFSVKRQQSHCHHYARLSKKIAYGPYSKKPTCARATPVVSRNSAIHRTAPSERRIKRTQNTAVVKIFN